MNWWHSSPALELAVPCSGSVHHLVWREGAVSVVDHPELDAERALIGLGGQEPMCLADQRLWQEAVADGGFLAEWVDEANLSATRLSWLTMALERMRNEGFHEFLRHLPLKRAERMGQFLRRFPQPWLDMAAGAVAEAIVDGDGVSCQHAAQLLPTAIANRVRRSFVSSVGGNQVAVGAAALVPLTIEVTTRGEPWAGGHLTGADRGISLAVDSSWLHEVWAAGANVIDRHLVLGRHPRARGRRGERPDPISAHWPPEEVVVLSWHNYSHSFIPSLERRSACYGQEG